MDKKMAHYPLDVPAPHHYTFAVRDIPEVTIEQRERALNATHWNEFAFPAAMLTVDMLSDSGTTAMTNHQWASLFLGDEAYGRNTGYYVPVSYTHLDHYKWRVLRANAVPEKYVTGNASYRDKFDRFAAIMPCLIAVSYTHL